MKLYQYKTMQDFIQWCIMGIMLDFVWSPDVVFSTHFFFFFDHTNENMAQPTHFRNRYSCWFVSNLQVWSVRRCPKYCAGHSFFFWKNILKIYVACFFFLTCDNICHIKSKISNTSSFRISNYFVCYCESTIVTI